MSQTTDPSKATTKPTMSHAIPFAKNHLGIGAVVAAILAVLNGHLSVVVPPWVPWIVVGLLVLGWIIHTIVADHALIHGAMANAQTEASAHSVVAWIKDLADVLPQFIDFMDALGTHNRSRAPGGEAAAPASDKTPRPAGPSGIVGAIEHAAEDVAHVVEDLTGKHPATVQSSAPTTPADSSSLTGPATTSAQG